MSDALVTIRFDGNGRTYCPGETLAGEYRIRSVDVDEVRAVEISVLWYTEGKGDEDLSVHEFHRLACDEGDRVDPDEPGRFSTILPQSPLSYEGQIVKIRWCVRVRVFLNGGRELMGQQRFRLGSVAPARAAVPHKDLELAS